MSSFDQHASVRPQRIMTLDLESLWLAKVVSSVLSVKGSWDIIDTTNRGRRWQNSSVETSVPTAKDTVEEPQEDKGRSLA